MLICWCLLLMQQSEADRCDGRLDLSKLFNEAQLMPLFSYPSMLVLGSSLTSLQLVLLLT